MIGIDEQAKRHATYDTLERHMAESPYEQQLVIGMACNLLTYLEARDGLHPARVRERLAEETDGHWVPPVSAIDDVFEDLAQIGLVERDASGKITPHSWAVRYLEARDLHNPWITRVA